MTQSADPTIALVQTLVAEAKRLGLVWTLRPATAVSGDASALVVQMDGDDSDTNITAINMLGKSVANGTRVMTVTVPPGGLFVLGFAGEEDGTWIDYTPVLSASTPPVINDGVITGRYRMSGKTVFCNGYVSFGAASTFGAGTWTISLPVAMNPDLLLTTGVVVLIDTSTAANRRSGGIDPVSAGTGTSFIMYAGSGGVVNAAAPFAWAAGDRVTWALVYEAA